MATGKLHEVKLTFTQLEDECIDQFLGVDVLGAGV